MKLIELEKAVLERRGEFLCERINDGNQTRVVRFMHLVTLPEAQADLPTVGRLNDVYDTFGSILFYLDEASGDAGKFLAPPAKWALLHEDFSDWLDDLDEHERQEYLPEWIDACLVIGEIPHSGNYILVPTVGDTAGHVVEFDHDGLEFTDEAPDVVAYIEKLLVPDNATLTSMASHMRFIDGDPMVQWWIREMRDNKGHVARTRKS